MNISKQTKLFFGILEKSMNFYKFLKNFTFPLQILSLFHDLHDLHDLFDAIWMNKAVDKRDKARWNKRKNIVRVQ